MAGWGKVPLLVAAIGGLSTTSQMKQGAALLLKISTSFWGSRDTTRWSKGPAQARGMQPSKAVVAVLWAREQLLMITTCSLHCSTGSDALCPHPLANHQVHAIQARWRIILWWVHRLPLWSKNCQIPPFGYKKVKLVLQPVHCIIKPEQLVLQTGRSRETCRTSLSRPNFSSLIASSFIHKIFRTCFKRLLSVCSSKAGKIISEVLLKNTVLQGKTRQCWAEAQWHTHHLYLAYFTSSFQKNGFL